MENMEAISQLCALNSQRYTAVQVVEAGIEKGNF